MSERTLGSFRNAPKYKKNWNWNSVHIITFLLVQTVFSWGFIVLYKAYGFGSCTCTICRGWTESVGKFPRPWIGTHSPRMESRRCTCSHDKTQQRRLCSDTSAEDMAKSVRWKHKSALWMSAGCPYLFMMMSDEFGLQQRVNSRSKRGFEKLFYQRNRIQIFAEEQTNSSFCFPQ